MTIDYLPWDSETFGFKVGNLLCTEPIEVEDLRQMVLKSHEDKYKLLYCKDVSVPNTALSDGFFLADEKVVYRTVISEFSCCVSDLVKSILHQAPNNDLLLLALQSGGHSRYFLDKKMPIHVFLSLYSKWVQNSLDGSIASDVLAYQIDGKNVGILTYKHSNDVVTIGLIAVDYAYASRGIGSKLLNHMFSLFPQGTIVEVATQKRNVGACHFYEKNGFYRKHIQNIYHVWVDDYCKRIKL